MLIKFSSDRKEREVFDCDNKSIFADESFGENVEKIEIIRSGIQTLPKIPDSLRELEIYDCPNLTSIESFGENVEKIKIIRSGIQTLPKIPASVKKISLFDCMNLEQNPELMTNLLELEEAGCEVTFPQNWNFGYESNLARSRLNAIIAGYKKENPGMPTPEAIRELFGRFLTEGVGTRRGSGDRGSILEIIQGVNPVLEFFEANPNSIEWADEVAKNYLSGCVNQPVAGWLEIAAIVAIANKKGATDKINASSQLIALQAITNHIANLPTEEKPGSGVEVEAGNVLFREIHKRLLKDKIIEEPWIAVPSGVRFERFTNAGFLREEVRGKRIEAAYEKVKSALVKSTKEKADFLCEGCYSEIWGQIAFPKEIAAIKEDFDMRMAEETETEKLESLGFERGRVIGAKIREMTDDIVNPKPKQVEATESKKPTRADKFRDRVKEVSSAHKMTRPDGLRREVKFSDFSRREPKDFYADDILTRRAASYNTPTHGKLNPSKIQHGDVASIPEGKVKSTKSRALKCVEKSGDKPSTNNGR